MLDFAKKTFEGLVCPLLQGYLGRYIKDIHKEQLNISLWNGEVLLENVELILESFEYLQLPFALKEGRVGRLSIKIPWTKLGREPIVISLEDVFICVSRRDEEEWSLDAVEKREVAAKKAKLAAAELAKLSRRVCDNQAGRSFNPYITAKILDGIQVSIRNFHVAYSDIQNDEAHIMFGLRFSSLTVMKQNSLGSFSGRIKGGQVNKIVEIRGIQVHFSRFPGAVDLLSFDKMWDPSVHNISSIKGNQWDHILAPFDVFASLSFNRSGNVDIDAPQYSVSGDISDLVLSLDEVQMQQILIIWDYLSTYQLREKYGRYRPWSSTLSIKPPGWQKIWWYYAQESVLSDVRRKLKKTSWKYLGQRLSYRRKYINLYKTKLDFLRLEKSVDESTLRELEQMERESDIDDILSYRSTAEHEVQELLSKALVPSLGTSCANLSVEKSQSDERSSGRSRGWLNWLSHGMLGAGGTDDSNQFSGVISDEVVKDIYEATAFHPPDVSNGDSAYNYKLYSSAFKFSIGQISVKLRRIKTGQEIIQLIIDGGNIDCKCCDDFATVNVFIKSWKMLNPCSSKDIIREPSAEIFLESEQPSCEVQVDVSHKHKVEVSVKVNLQPIEVTWDPEFLLNMFKFVSLLQSFEFHDGRVLASINGFGDVRARLLSKTEFVLSNRAKVIWDVSIVNIILHIPWTNPVSEGCKMVLKSGACQLITKNNPDSHAPNIGDKSYILKHTSKVSLSDILTDFQLKDLYDLFELKLNDFEISMVIPQHPNMISVLKKCSSSLTLASCIISDESVLKQLEVGITSSSLHFYLSPSIYVCLLQLVVQLNAVHLGSKSPIVRDHGSYSLSANESEAPVPLLSINVNVDSFNFEVDFANDAEDSTILKLALGQLEICYYSADFEEFSVSLKSLKICTFLCRNEMDSLVLFSSDVMPVADLNYKARDFALCSQYKESDRRNSSSQACFYLHYQAQRSKGSVCHKCEAYLSDADLHFYPFLIKLLVGFYGDVSGYDVSSSSDNSNGHPSGSNGMEAMPTFNFKRFGYSNFLETGSSEYGSISLDSFPFLTVYNAGSLSSLENSLVHPIHEWRKYFNVRENEVMSPEGSMEKGSRTSLGQTVDPATGLGELSLSNGHCETNVVVLDLNLCGIKFHFHDSSSTVGTITLPIANSSLIICEEFLDMVCSTEGLVLTSSWWTRNFKDYLWGPSVSHLPPILNVRLRKGHAGSISSQIEVSFGVQNVCCVLPPEYLSIIIGYFSLPDWSYCSNKEPPSDFYYSVDMESDTSVMFKVEIIDSMLIFPVESGESRYLVLEIPELFFSFVLESASDNPFNDIHPECLVTPQVVAKRNNCLNIFGRNLFLSLLTFKNDAYSCIEFNQEPKCVSTTLIDKLSADVWVRIPCETELSKERSYTCTSVMGKIRDCQLSADDCYAIDGFLNLVDAISQFSTVEKISECYKSDVAQFLRSKECVMKQEAIATAVTDPGLTEVKCCVDSLSIKLHQSRKDFNSPVPVARIDMQFVFSASLREETLICADVIFYSLAIYSLLSSVILVQCNKTCSTLSVLVISLSKSSQGANELLLILPSIDAWIYVYDWTQVINLFICYTEKLKASVTINATSGNSLEEKPCTAEKAAFPTESSVQCVGTSSYSMSKKVQQGSFNLAVRSEDVGIAFHFPVSACHILERPKAASTNSTGGNYGKIIEVTVHCNGEVSTDGLNTRLKVNLEKVSGSVGIYENQSLSSWPFFQISQVDVDAEICTDESELSCARVEVNCDRLDMWFSYHIFYFWHDLISAVPESGSPQFGFRELEFRFKIRTSSFLLTDGRWTCSGPLLEMILKSFIVHADVTESSSKTSVASDLHLNYNNINKVLWESFVEPWSFQIKITREHERIALLNGSIVTDVNLLSTAPLNLNFTESFFECVFRTTEMVKDACGLMGETNPENHEFSSLHFTKNVYTRRYAPYVLQNLTSLPLAYHVYRGMDNVEDISASEMNDENSVQPGSLVPIYLNESPEEQLIRYRPAHSSDKLSEKQTNGGPHHYITIQFDGTAECSAPMSMDLVGRTYFEVDFSNVSRNIEAGRAGNTSCYNIGSEDNARGTEESGFVVPVVFDVSVQRHSKLIRLYSTVILLNATSIPMELKFEIPFALSPKILGPIDPGKEFPLPLHLAEAGSMKWRPLEKTVLWSEAYNVSNILSQESKTGFLRSVVCYPSLPRSDPFRCCISVKSIILPSSKKPKDLFHLSETSKKPVENYGLAVHELDKSRRRFVHQISFSTPLVVNNYLPEAISLRLETAGETRTVLLSEIVTPFHHIDPTQDLGLEFHLDGYEPSFLKFPRAETFTTVAKFSGTKFSLTEIMTFNPVTHNGPVHIIVEKSMDAFSGARELFVFVPFLLYNCTGFPLAISEAGNEMKGAGYIIPSCYELIEQELFQPKTDGLCLLTSDLNSNTAPHIDSPRCPLRDNHIISSRKNINLQLGTLLSKPYMSSGSSKPYCEQLNGHSFQDRENSSSAIKDGSGLNIQVNTRDSNGLDSDPGKVKPCMYSPNPTSSATEFMVRMSRWWPEFTTRNTPTSSWSVPFSLVPPSGSTNVFVPRSSPKAAYIICITSSPLGGPLAGRTQAITFQPRYVIANACTKDLCYKQKGTDQVFRLGVGQHSHLHYTDTTRELLVSIRFFDPGWQWSGNFLADHIGDTQVKMRNYTSGSVKMIRIEVQNADVSIRDEQIVGNLHGNSGTNLVLLSDDDTGYMPYRIDNFSREKLRIYQQKCETFDTIIHPYTSSPYTWDEPCYPHRLTVEVPGERVLGSYSLDDTKEYAPAYLASTSEKPERILLLSVHAEGATKVLSVIDSNYHISKDMMGSDASPSKERGKSEPKRDKLADYREKLSLTISCIGISLVDSYPQELLFLSAKNITMDLLQSLDQQKLCFQISEFQVDNQLPTTPYPVILSFDREHGRHSVNLAKKPLCQPYEPVFNLAVAKWRKKDISLVSFEYINLRVADVHLELEQEVVLSLFDLYRTVYSRFQDSILPIADPTFSPSVNDMALQEGSFKHTQIYVNTNKSHFQLPDVLTSDKNRRICPVLPSGVPIGAPWQQIYLLARRQKKVYIESLDIAPIKLTVSFSSTPWMLRNGVLTSGESVIHRGLMALADIEGARIHLKKLSIMHHMASLESVQEILMRHYTRQLLHEIYKVFGSAGVIGNPMGFARSVGLGIKDFLSVPARSALQSPTGLFTGMAQGTTSLLSNTVYAISDAATQFTKAAHKGIVAFTFDDQAKEVTPHSKGVINEVLEGLTGLLQSPIRGAEKHGLPGVLSGVAMGLTGLVARPAASILEVTGKTAQSIRNRSRLSHVGQHRYRIRLPRPLSRELPLRPYSWEEAVGMSLLTEADDDLKFKDEVLVTCKMLKHPGKFVIVTERLILVASSSSLEDFGKPEFRGFPVDLEWVIESEVGLESVIHADAVEGTVHIVGSSSDVMQKHHQSKKGTPRTKHWSNPPTPLPLFQTNLEFISDEDAENLLQILLSMIEHGKERGWGSRHLLHQSNLK